MRRSHHAITGSLEVTMCTNMGGHIRNVGRFLEESWNCLPRKFFAGSVKLGDASRKAFEGKGPEQPGNLSKVVSNWMAYSLFVTFAIICNVNVNVPI